MHSWEFQGKAKGPTSVGLIMGLMEALCKFFVARRDQGTTMGIIGGQSVPYP